ncbi:MAG: SAM-dependent methyltransferase [Betaproteobacteria bacterium]|nr:SAM-dependent methyltransferase [Betaproteobacteria bacterium]MCL2886886.1 SAM-dependent methyltransferase [Betaproteobacteria bacterium]
MNPLPPPDPDALAHSQRLRQWLARAIGQEGGWLPFSRFMEGLLYAPGLGYYAAGARKFGATGDFVTAPEMTPLFAAALAAPVAAGMAASSPAVLEFGAGSGRLAADLLLALEARQTLPEQYFILDLSAELRQRQQANIAAAAPHLAARVVWLDCLPPSFSGVVLGNELLDALPVDIVVWREDGIFSRGVGLAADGDFMWSERPADGALLAAAREIAGECPLAPGYASEIGLASRAWTAEWGHRLQRGLLLLIDYGFPRHEFYHPQRGDGTLMCHYRHYAHPDPFYLPGLQDVTAHVDFTAIAAAAHSAGLDVLGYASQGRFLLECGILDRLGAIPGDSIDYLRAASAVNKLLLPHEMGELFKVIALGRGLTEPLCGFASGDQRHRL